jgi:hypothetical protein
MSKPRVYVETTLPSFHHEIRTNPAWRRAMRNDQPIDELREVRRRISARFDHDPARLVAYSVQLHEQYRDRLLAPTRTPDEADRAAA